ncbi:hypothetical protein ACWGNE_03605 [Streptomyces xiamenensis]
MPPSFAAIALLLIITLCYLASCAVSPFGPCRRCNGFGFRITSDRAGRPKRGRGCRRCKGYGRRIRPGRRLSNAISRTRREGNR